MIAMAGSERQARPGSTLLESTSANWYGTAWPNINHVYIYVQYCFRGVTYLSCIFAIFKSIEGYGNWNPVVW